MKFYIFVVIAMSVVVGLFFETKPMSDLGDFLLFKEIYKHNSDAHMMLSMLWGAIASWLILIPYCLGVNRRILKGVVYKKREIAAQFVSLVCAVIMQVVLWNIVDSEEFRPSKENNTGRSYMVFSKVAFAFFVVVPVASFSYFFASFISNVFNLYRENLDGESGSNQK